jgi:NADH:ubiquinone oxidoreductase subunit 6 (subunit J)
MILFLFTIMLMNLNEEKKFTDQEYRLGAFFFFLFDLFVLIDIYKFKTNC